MLPCQKSQILRNKQNPSEGPLHSFRKITPLLFCDTVKLPQDRVQEFEKQDCFKITGEEERKVRLEQAWAINEHFYSHLDQQHYHQPQLGMIFQQLNITQPITFQKFKAIQNVLPKPAKFDRDFIDKQRLEVKNARRQKKTSSKIGNIRVRIGDLLGLIRLTAGTQVWAVHPICHHLHSGILLTQYKGQDQLYVIKFNKQTLGSHRVSEENISSDFIAGKEKGQGGIKDKNSLDQCDLEAFAFYSSLLEIQDILMSALKKYHNLAEEKNIEGAELDEGELQNYGWIGSMIAIINIVCKYLQANFCIFGAKRQSQGGKGPKGPLLRLSQHYAGPSNLSQDLDQFQDEGEEEAKDLNRYQNQNGGYESENNFEAIYRKYSPILRAAKGGQAKQSSDCARVEVERILDGKKWEDLRQLESHLRSLTEKFK